MVINDREIDFYYTEDGQAKISRGLIRINAGYNIAGGISIIRNRLPGGARPSYMPLHSQDQSFAAGDDMVYLEMASVSTDLFDPWTKASYKWTTLPDSSSSWHAISGVDQARQCYAWCHRPTTTTTLAPRQENVWLEREFCALGYQPDTDTETGDWLCLDRERCQKLCESTASCGGFTIHQTLPRCKLHKSWLPSTNGPYIDDFKVLADDEHDLVVRRPRYFEFAQAESNIGVLLQERGYSSETLLRFKVPQAPVGCQKVCFCNGENGETCSSTSRFEVFVGEVASTALTCSSGHHQLFRPDLHDTAALDCSHNYHGGQSCTHI